MVFCYEIVFCYENDKKNIFYNNSSLYFLYFWHAGNAATRRARVTRRASEKA